MEFTTVKKLMVPRQEYVTLPDSSTLYEAVVALENHEKESGKQRLHTTIIVVNQSDQAVSRLSIFDFMRGIEPKYNEISSINLNHFGFSNDYLESIFKKSGLWAEPLEKLCAKAVHIKIKEIMLDLSPSETIHISDSLNKALHKMILNKHESLLVMDDRDKFAGMIRSIDLFKLIREQIRECNYEKSQE
ncbi:MAG: HPP family protein [Desulfonatronovibrio sp.]